MVNTLEGHLAHIFSSISLGLMICFVVCPDHCKHPMTLWTTPENTQILQRKAIFFNETLQRTISMLFLLVQGLENINCDSFVHKIVLAMSAFFKSNVSSKVRQGWVIAHGEICTQSDQRSLSI